MTVEIGGVDLNSNERKVRIAFKDHLKVKAIIEPIERHINETEHKYWSLPFEAIDPTADDDMFFYLKNGGDNDIHVTDIRISSTVAGIAEVIAVTGTATNGTTITPVNRTIGNSNSLANGSIAEHSVVFGGITETGLIFPMTLTADTQEHLKTSGHIIIPKGQAIALNWLPATGALTGVVSVFEDTAD